MAIHNHVQTSASATWTITHNFNVASVVVDVFVDFGGNLEKILPLEIEHTNDNTLTVTFSSTQTGKARLVG